MRVVLLALILLRSTVNFAQVPTPFHLSKSQAFLYAGTAFDLWTTRTAARRGYSEANPILGQSPYRQSAFAVGGAMAVDLLSRWAAREGHPKAAKILRVIGGGAHVGAGLWNLSGRHQ